MCVDLQQNASANTGRQKARTQLKKLASPPSLIAMWCALAVLGQILGTSGNIGAATAQAIDKSDADPVSSAAPANTSGAAAENKAPADLADPQAPNGQVSAPNSRPLRISAGDQLKIAVYERLEVEEDKWGKSSDRVRARTMSLQMRTEFTGDYAVQEDGTISFPLLGTFTVSDRTLEDVQGLLAKTYETTIGRPGIVNVRLAERAPVYVLGPVKNSGLYKFTSGMTVWHAVALAGGFERTDRAANDLLGYRLEATREIGNVERNRDRVASLMARREVMAAEREKRPASAPDDLIALVGKNAADSLVAGEMSTRSLVSAAQQARINGIRGTIQSVRDELDASRQRMGLIELAIKGQDERLTALRTLGAEGHVKRPQLIEAEVQLTQAQERREEARIGSSQAEQRITQAEQELAKLNSDAKLELESQLASIDRELTETRSQRTVGLNVLDALKTTSAGKNVQDIERNAEYVIVRRAASGTITVPASGDSELQPGDLVKVSISTQTRIAR